MINAQLAATGNRMATKKRTSRRSSRTSRYSKAVVRRGGADDLYIQKDGTWGPYKSAKRFSTQDVAEEFYFRFHTGKN